jgi:hypothetical protein
MLQILILITDGVRTTVKGEYSLCIANNICTAAKGMKLAPDAKLNDGLIDVILVNSKKTLDLAQLFPKFYDGSHVKLKFVEYKQVHSLTAVISAVISAIISAVISAIISAVISASFPPLLAVYSCRIPAVYSCCLFRPNIYRHNSAFSKQV